MVYRIDFDCPLGDEVRRIAAELLSGAVDVLEKQPQGQHEAIHDARKNIKRIRALYRLIASDAPDFAASENSRLRDIARDLSHLRDSAALAETTSYLEKETEHKASVRAIRRLGRTMEKRRDRIAGDKADIVDTFGVCCDGLQQARRALDHLDLPRLCKQATECIARGWQKTGRRAYKALSACRHTDADEPFHDLRKRAQDRFMHASLLQSLWPSGMASIQGQAKALAGLLGHEHDLALLSGHVEGSTPEKSEAEKAQLLASIAAERQKLQSAAREAASEIFDAHPKRDAAIIALLIRNRR